MDHERQMALEFKEDKQMHMQFGAVRARTSSDAFVFGSESTEDGVSAADVSRKQRHNLREQRRIMRIGNQFEQLKKKLEAVGFLSNKKDKHSILQATIEYIAAMEREAHVAGVAAPMPRQTTSNASTSAPTTPLESGKENAAISMHPANKQPLLDDMPSTNPSIEYMWNPLQAPQCVPEMVFDSTASFRNVFLHSSLPSLITRLDGAVVDANYVFHDYFSATPEELRMHSLYTLCMPSDVPKMQNLVSSILTCELNTAYGRLTFHCGMERHVFASVALIRDHTGQAVNIHCALFPMS